MPRGAGKPFVKGDPRCGRPKGSENQETKDRRELATRFVQDVEYQDALRQRLIAGTASAAVETMLWYYAYGKPKETVDIETNDVPVVLYRIPSNGRELAQ